MWKSLNRVMAPRCGKRHPTTALPGAARADHSRAGDRGKKRLTHKRTLLLLWGLTARQQLPPQRGKFKVFNVEKSARSLRDVLLYGYIGLLVAGAAGLVASFVVSGIGLGSPVAVGALCAIAMYAEAQTVRLTPAVEVSVSSIVFVLAAVLFGPLAAVVVGATGLVVELFNRDGDKALLRWLSWTSSRVLVAGAAGVVAYVITDGTERTMGILLFAVAAASLADVAGDALLTPIPAVLRGKGSWLEIARALLPVQVSALPLHVPVISVLAYAYLRISPWSVALFGIPAFAAQRLFLLYRRQAETSKELSSANLRLASANLSFASALVATLDARDRYTAGHSAAVAIYARDIAARLGLTPEEQERAHLCGLVHDIGKIGLAAGLLEKPGALTLEERRQMESHSVIGERILSKVDDYAEIASVVRHHHERIDGHGYPDRLVGEEIPLLSRIIAVADAYNAMTSDRPYRDAMPSRVARLRLAHGIEGQFDSRVVAAFEAVLAGASEGYRSGCSAEFSFDVQDGARQPMLSRVA